ncbi:MAG: TIGR01212 family radical SAM protein [Bdellovibrionales bacterium]|nr:TIGR01212 family radical SAM protein [Bdellovibrionales bacterium]
MQSDSWQGLPYFPISQFYKQRFGSKVYKIPVSTATTCPNREGLNGMQTCNFCDVWGSAAYPEIREQSLKEQITKTRLRMIELYKAQKFLVYFQAYTNTFSRVNELRRQFDVAKSFEDVVGIVVGTRPDCISEVLFDLWNETAEQMFMAVELGVQSFDEEQLLWMRRGHTAKRSLQAIERISQKCPKVDLGIHLMFGLPGETDQQIIDTALKLNDLPVHNVKLHNLHVLKDTPLEQDYLQGSFKPIEQQEYMQRVELFLRHLSPRLAIHRLAALSTRSEELVAPQWTALKMKTYQDMIDFMKSSNSFQGEALVEG